MNLYLSVYVNLYAEIDLAFRRPRLVADTGVSHPLLKSSNLASNGTSERKASHLYSRDGN